MRVVSFSSSVQKHLPPEPQKVRFFHRSTSLTFAPGIALSAERALSHLRLCRALWSGTVIAAILSAKKVSSGLCITAPGDLVDDFHHVEGLDLLLQLFGLDAVAEHRHTVRAGDRDDLRVSLKRLLGAEQIHPFIRVFLDPHPPSASTAAHAEFMVAFHLANLSPRAAEQHPRLVKYVVVTAVVTRVVVHGPLREFRRDLETSRSDQLTHEVGGMNDLVRTTELRKLVLDRVETMGTVHDDLTNFVFVEGFDQHLGHRLVKVLVSEPTGRFAVAKFLAREAGKVYACV